MAWTETDGEALFRQPPSEIADPEAQTPFDSSQEAMRRLRSPFDANPADVAEQSQEVPVDDDEYRG